MELDKAGLKILNIGKLVVGIWWIIGGAIALISAFLNSGEWLADGIFGTFFFVMGVGLLVVRPVRAEDLDKLKAFVARMRH